MPPVHDEGNGSPKGTGADTSSGLDQDPHPVAVHAAGWSSPVGWSTPPRVKHITSPRGDAQLSWTCVELDEVKLSRAATLLFAQGLLLSNLFPPDVRFVSRYAVFTYGSPPILLHAVPPNLSEVSPKLRKVVLGVVIQARGLEESEVRAAMLAHVLHP